ncbi:uncharacterized protein LOC122259316 [Penaeus japonicus]|uniref:uncharacterized protein LOC122259316 n=1 Tax=Penaeus japonicus TaxID=27405 RepID=UPI001C711533|nr:uncharacterized protein LOC122259316 [Penaeus japonicus]
MRSLPSLGMFWEFQNLDGLALEKRAQKMDTSCGTAVPRKNILKGKPRNMTIIQIYAPTSDSEDEEIERFYQDLDQTIKERAKKDILVIQGNWNAKIGYKESTGWEGTIGDFGKQAEDIEQSLAVNNSRKAYSVIKSLTKEKTGRTNVIEDKTGQLLTNNTEVTARWKEYCRELYQHQADVDRTVLAEATSEGEPEPVILESEVRAANIKLKMNKAPGFDNLPAELIKCGGDPIIKTLHLCNRILQTGKWPTQWTQSILIPIPKKKMSKKCSEHRTISLISHPSKVLLTIILNRIKPGIEEILDDSQAGFRKDRSTVEQILNLRLLCESQRNHQKNVFHNFIDFKKAFDRVWHEALWHTMAKYNINQGMTRLIQELYENAKTTVMVGNNYSEWFERGIKCTGRVVNNLRFADGIDLIAEDAEELQEITRRLDETSQVEAFEMKCYRRLLGITWGERRTNGYVRDRPEPFMRTIAKRKLQFFGHQVRRNKTSKFLIQDYCEGTRQQEVTLG